MNASSITSMTVVKSVSIIGLCSFSTVVMWIGEAATDANGLNLSNYVILKMAHSLTSSTATSLGVTTAKTNRVERILILSLLISG